MSMRTKKPGVFPVETVRVVRAAFPKGSTAIRLRTWSSPAPQTKAQLRDTPPSWASFVSGRIQAPRTTCRLAGLFSALRPCGPHPPIESAAPVVSRWG